MLMLLSVSHVLSSLDLFPMCEVCMHISPQLLTVCQLFLPGFIFTREHGHLQLSRCNLYNSNNIEQTSILGYVSMPLTNCSQEVQSPDWTSVGHVAILRCGKGRENATAATSGLESRRIRFLGEEESHCQKKGEKRYFSTKTKNSNYRQLSSITNIYFEINYYTDFPGGSDGKESAYNAGDPGSIPGLGQSPGGGNGKPLQYSCLQNPMDRGAWGGHNPWGHKESEMIE